MSICVSDRDMTHGKPAGLLIGFAVPIFIGNVFQQFYNITDSVIVGRFLGADALAAVGLCGCPYGVFISLNMGLSTGIGIVISQLFGAKQEEQIKAMVINAFLLILATSFLIGGAGFFLAPGILKLLGTPEAIMFRSMVYMRTVFVGTLGMAVYGCIAGILRALGDSRTPLLFLVFSSILNIVLDVLFVALMPLDVFGAALATLLSQFISAIVCFLYARRKYDCFNFGMQDLSPDREIIKKLLKAGLPIALQSSTISFSGMVLQGFVNSFGEDVIAANTVVGKFDNLINMPLGSLSMALSTYTGQNTGAGDLQRVKAGYKAACGIAVVYSILIFAAGHVGCRAFVEFFVTGSPEVCLYGVQGIRLLSCGVIALSMIYINRSVLNGAGDVTFAMFNGIVEVFGRVGFAWIYTSVLAVGARGLWLTAVSNWLLTGSVCLLRYISGVWKKKKFEC